MSAILAASFSSVATRPRRKSNKLVSGISTSGKGLWKLIALLQDDGATSIVLPATLECAAGVRFRHEMRERLEVAQRLAARGAPRPLPSDRGGEAELEQGVEVAVGSLENLTQNSVELIGGDVLACDPAHQVDVADLVDCVGDPEQPPVATQQKRVHVLVVLINVPADKGLHPHTVRTHRQHAGGVQLRLTGQRH